MPDGDIVHNRLRRLYQNPYKFLCEGKASTGECAWAVVKALKLDLIKKGNLPIILAQRMAERLTQILGGSEGNTSVDWANLNIAGLYTRLRTHPKKSFVLFGTGSNEIVYARQEEVAEQIRSIFPGRSTLYRVPIRFRDSNEHRKNKITRARGVVFTLLGSACAYLMGQRELCVYENGIGAINLPYRASAVGLDHSRSVHPLTLLMVSNVVSELLGEAFRVYNPFLFSTKAEMCQTLAEDRRADLVSLAKSCDSPHRQQPDQCGYCSSCILRRQSLAAAKIEDKTRYVILHGNQPAADPSVYLRHMLAQVHTLRSLLNSSDCPTLQWEALTRKFPVLDDIVDRGYRAENLSTTEMQRCLLQLYRNYVAEWSDVASQLSIALLDSSDQQSPDECWSVV